MHNTKGKTMKTLLTLTALFLCTSALAAIPPVSECNHYLKGSSFDFEVLSDGNLSTQSLKELDLDFKGTFTAHINTYSYATVDLVKLTKDHWGYGATVGVQDTYQHFTPYGEVHYSHNYTQAKNVSDQNFDYNTGIKLAYFTHLTPFIEADDFVNSNRWFVKTGVKYKLNDRYYLLADYSSPSHIIGAKVGFGGGVQF